MFAINGLPYLIFRRFRIEDESIKVKDESFYHMPNFNPCYTCSIMRSEECYLLDEAILQDRSVLDATRPSPMIVQ